MATSVRDASMSGDGNGPPSPIQSTDPGERTQAPLLVGSDSLEFVEGLYDAYARDAEIPAEWRDYFDRLTAGQSAEGDYRREPTFVRRSIFHPPGGNGSEPKDLHQAVLQERVDQFIRNYRVRGHMISRLDPLDQPRSEPPELHLEFYGFSEADLDRFCSTTWAGGPQVRTLREIIDWLRHTYCRFIGVQFMHIDSLHVRQWLQERIESTANRITVSRDRQLQILRRLVDAVVFEEFLQKKYPGAKSFSLEGAESLIPLLELSIETAREQGVEEMVLAMAHRGRLNVLANVIGKSPREIFREFEDVDPELHLGRGDVKYHLGYSSDRLTISGQRMHLSLCFNPSHLEFVNPVALGRTRAKQDLFGDVERRRGMALIIHGDAAFAGEGLVQESLNLSGLEAYRVGGAVHVVVNNQLGFTTSPSEARSTIYPTDVAKMLQAPIFHVNGEEPEAVAQVVQLALDFRKAFQRDVIIDMWCYRQRGHNEGDEPEFTQPLLYRAIKREESVRQRYERHLVELGEVTEEEVGRIAEERRELLEQELATARSKEYVPQTIVPAGIWSGYVGGREDQAADVETGVPAERLAALLESQTRLPEGFRPHRKIEWAIDRRREMARGEKPLDWSAAESLAFATLSTDGVRIRMSGQDSARGTFSQRHAVLHDIEDGDTYMPLQHLSDDQAPVEIYNSPLSEAGVLGFEYGYSLDCPNGLVLWEAQFGDFSNAAQVIIDQFIASAEDKWRRLSGLVLLLPHGAEGQGPEHSSARLERFLSLAAEDNIQIVYPTLPAQYFHCLRRQALRRWRKPLIVMTPKSLLRHPQAVSTLEQCAEGRFRGVIGDDRAASAQAKRVLLCTGKIYYELAAEREKLGRNDVAIIRVEQLYPFPERALSEALEGYTEATPATWVQEEPENMGAWGFVRLRCGDTLFGRLPLSGVSRPASASPGSGSAMAFKLEQQQLLTRAFGGV